MFWSSSEGFLNVWGLRVAGCPCPFEYIFLAFALSFTDILFILGFHYTPINAVWVVPRSHGKYKKNKWVRALTVGEQLHHSLDALSFCWRFRPREPLLVDSWWMPHIFIGQHQITMSKVWAILWIDSIMSHNLSSLYLRKYFKGLTTLSHVL